MITIVHVHLQWQQQHQGISNYSSPSYIKNRLCSKGLWRAGFDSFDSLKELQRQKSVFKAIFEAERVPRSKSSLK